MTRRTRRGVPVPVLAAWALAPAIMMAGAWQYAEANVPPTTTTTTTTLPPPPRAELATPLFSYRRHPSPIADRVAASATARAVAAQVERFEDEIPDGSCVRVVDGDTVIADIRPDLPLIPASNEKLIIAAVALEVLGPDHRFRTELQSPRPVGGVIPGDVYLIGGGDPVLRTADVPDPLRYPAFNTTALEPLVDQLAVLGITEIQGDIVGDGSRYDDEFRVPEWGDDISNVDAGPYDALLVNDGLIGRGNYGLNPSRSAARVFFDLAAARGITITGAAANRDRPVDADLTTLALVESLPLDDVLVEMLHTSDNNTAEMLVKEIGFVRSGDGTRPAGLEQVRAVLADWDVPLAGVELRDGSGLSRDNRLTCRALTSVLAAAPPGLVDVLPVAGRDGTLATQFLGTDAEGRLQAKTGTLTGVKALTGTQPAGDGRPVDFSVVMNGEGVDDPAVHLPVWTAVIDLIGDYPIVIDPDVDRFTPR